MNRNSDIRHLFPGYYNHPLLHEGRRRSGLSLRRIAAKLHMSDNTVRRVFAGTASQKQVWPVAAFFKLSWSALHDLSLKPSDFDRAVLNGNSKAARSLGPKRVGELRPAPVLRGGTYTRGER